MSHIHKLAEDNLRRLKDALLNREEELRRATGRVDDLTGEIANLKEAIAEHEDFLK